ncbi:MULTISPECIES: signal peptidase I [unclassified Bacillus (in: firmicutes)]|uniref:signal peptidase I n=1 Tax=Bacillus sp. FJAT-27986 TaxID=1743146 RepID=UPI00080AF67D|nr:signal peptidase I [Bacillus sp. FJAT-27986]
MLERRRLRLRKLFKTEVGSWIISIAFAIVLAYLVKTFIISFFIVEGASMEPTLYNNEKVLVNKLAAYSGSVDRQDIVVIRDDGKDKYYIKRIIGLPGEKVEYKNDSLYINGKQKDEPYLPDEQGEVDLLKMNKTGDFDPLKVPNDHYFVMGDNRLNSRDSRNGLGYIDEDDIVGTCEYVILPFEHARKTD